MSITNWPFYINFAVFSVFLTLFVTELMGAVLLLRDYERSRSKVLPYIVPIWEVTGTFAAFWVVTADFAYPSMLIPVASLLAGAIVVFLIFLVARNASISFAEYIVKRRWLDEKKLYQAYAVSTLLIGVVVVMILSAIISGAGVDLGTMSFSLGGWIGSPGSLLYLVGVLLIAAGLAPVFYAVDALRRWTVPLTAAGVLVEVGALALYSHSFLTWPLLVPAVLTVAAAVLYQSRRLAPLVSNKLVFGLLSCVIIFSQNFLVYPTAFGGRLSVDAVTTSGPMVQAFEILSVAGAILIGLLMTLYMVASRRSAEPARPPGGPAAGAASVTQTH
jgi:cytochrome bd ubiquinol oxidase subunit II